MAVSARNAYLRIATSLREQIESGVLEPGAFLPTERELQERFTAGRSTVRRALAQLVESGCAQNVPNRGVIVLRAPQERRLTGNVALIDAGSDILRLMGMRLAAKVRDEGLYLVHLGGSVEYPTEKAIQTALDNDFAGAIVWPYRAFPDTEFMAQAAKRLPIISLDHRQEGAETDLVTVDHESAAAEATEQLIRNGCRRIAITGMMDALEITHHRFRGYLKALFKHGLRPRPRDFAFCATSGADGPDTFLLESRIAAADRPDGILILQDLFAPVTVETILRMGLSVPHDIKIVAIGDDIDLTVDGLGMTAVGFDWDAMAAEAVKVLLKRIAAPDQPVRTTFIPHKLVVRGLCGAPAAECTPVKGVDTAAGRLLPRSRYQYSSSRSALETEPAMSR